MSITLDTLRSIKIPTFISPSEWKLTPRRYSSLYDLVALGVASISGAAYFEILPAVTSYTVSASTHLLPSVTNLMLLNPADEEVSVSYSVDTSNNVYIESNISLLNHKLILS